MKKTKRKQLNATTLLIALCWIVYTCSYLGKLGYNANITQVQETYSISRSEAGMVGTLFFFAYGIGQVVNGIFCKKYNVRFVVFGGLLISGLMNLLVGITENFTIIKYFWMLNGAALSVLWPSLIRTLSESLDEESVGRAVVIMGTPVATGTAIVYGLSALFIAFLSYKAMFFLAGIMLPIIAVLWIIFYPKLAKPNTKEKEIAAAEQGAVIQKNGSKIGVWWASIGILAIFAVFANLVKDGLTTWVPMILKENYSLPDYFSTLLAVVLPVFAIFGTMVVVILHKKIKDFVVLASVLFFVAVIFMGVVILCMPTGLFVITLGGFGVEACLMSGINNVITSMTPLYWKDKVNSGLLAGVLDGFCYLGSTLSSYGLGLIADISGWSSVLWLLFGLCVTAVCISLCYVVVIKIRKKR